MLHSDRTKHNDFVRLIEIQEQSLKMTKAQVAKTNKILKKAQDAEDKTMI